MMMGGGGGGGEFLCSFSSALAALFGFEKRKRKKRQLPSEPIDRNAQRVVRVQEAAARSRCWLFPLAAVSS